MGESGTKAGASGDTTQQALAVRGVHEGEEGSSKDQRHRRKDWGQAMSELEAGADGKAPGLTG